jgi:hypothetical protein
MAAACSACAAALSWVTNLVSRVDRHNLDRIPQWGAFSENVPEAKDMFEARYEKLLGSY